MVRVACRKLELIATTDRVRILNHGAVIADLFQALKRRMHEPFPVVGR